MNTKTIENRAEYFVDMDDVRKLKIPGVQHHPEYRRGYADAFLDVCKLARATQQASAAPTDDTLSADEIARLRDALVWMGESTYESLEECEIYRQRLVRRLVSAVLAQRDQAASAAPQAPAAGEVKPWRERAKSMAITDAMKAEIAELRAQLVSAQTDADRYRWLRNEARNASDVAPIVVMMGDDGRIVRDVANDGLRSEEELDESVDAARAQLTNTTGN